MPACSISGAGPKVEQGGAAAHVLCLSPRWDRQGRAAPGDESQTAPVEGSTPADDVAADHVLRDERGLHIKAWGGRAHMFRLVLSENSQGSVTGNLSAERAHLASLHTQADFDGALGAQFPHVPASLRRLIAASVVVRPSSAPCTGPYTLSPKP